MTYWLVNAWFLGAVAVVGLVVSLMPWRPKWVAALGALGIVGVLTAILTTPSSDLASSTMTRTRSPEYVLGWHRLKISPTPSQGVS